MHASSDTLERLTRFMQPWVRDSNPPFAICLRDRRIGPRTVAPRFTLEFPDPNTLERLLRDGDLAGFAEAYLDGDLRVTGDVEAAVGLVRNLRALLPAGPSGSANAPGTKRTAEDDARWVRAHYDLPNELFRLFLDEELVYSCAYFGTPDDSIETAQVRKLELSCRKLHLRPEHRLLDVGCGWGALLFHAARHFGTRSFGITLSGPQAEHVRQRARDLGMEGRVAAAVKHYDELDRERFDRIVSIGMVEHVGISRLPRYFGKLYESLEPGGLLLNHGITVPASRSFDVGGAFIRRHVFPGSELDDIGHTVRVMEDAGFEILDVQSLRPHYALTLRQWSRRWFAHRSEAAQLVPERVLRTWDIYLPACAEAFDAGLVGVHQVLAHKRDPSGTRTPPLTREALMGAPPDLLNARRRAESSAGGR